MDSANSVAANAQRQNAVLTRSAAWLTTYGACAAVGVVAAMALSGRAARRVDLSAEAVWDAGAFALLSCFVASRLLLVLRDPVAFVHFPLLVLGLPSLTLAGLGVAAVAVWVYLWRKRLPVLRMLDVYAPCGAVLAGSLELGHWVDGSEPGMPVLRVGGASIVEFRPVSAYGVALSVGLGLVLWRALGVERVPGRVAALGLILGGVVAFGLDMITLPVEMFGSWWLEPGQCVALGAMLGGAALWTFAPGGELLAAEETEVDDAAQVG